MQQQLLIDLIHNSINEAFNGLSEKSARVRAFNQLYGRPSRPSFQTNEQIAALSLDLITSAIELALQELDPDEYETRLGIDQSTAKRFLEELLNKRND